MIEYGPKHGSFVSLLFRSTCSGLADTGRDVANSVDVLRLGFPPPFLDALHCHVFSNCMTS
jgi:hypothetical protein